MLTHTHTYVAVLNEGVKTWYNDIQYSVSIMYIYSIRLMVCCTFSFMRRKCVFCHGKYCVFCQGKYHRTASLHIWKEISFLRVRETQVLESRQRVEHWDRIHIPDTLLFRVLYACSFQSPILNACTAPYCRIKLSGPCT